MKVSVRIINAFVDDGEGGNPAGVLLDADGLDRAQRQRVAARVGLSETAFVSRSEIADVRLDFFTPTRQIAHCGHATVATFVLLDRLGRIDGPDSSKETIDGRREIRIEDGMAFLQQSAPRYSPLDRPVAALMDSIGLSTGALLEGATPEVVNTGNSFLVIPLAGLEALAGATPDLAAIEAISEALDLIGFYLFALETLVPGRDVATRMFAPRYGIPEEAATGSGAGTLAAFLHDRLGLDRPRLVIEQGRLMTPASPSVLHANVHTRDGRIDHIFVGGHAAEVDQVQIPVD